MVTKDRKKKQKQKQWNEENKEEKRVKAQSSYMQNRQAVIDRAGSRMLTDRTLRKHNATRIKARLQNDTKYKDTNKACAANNDSKKRNNPDSREQHLLKMRQRLKTKLATDSQYREEQRVQMRQRMKSRLESDAKYREEHLCSMKKAYHVNTAYHDANKMRAKHRYNQLHHLENYKLHRKATIAARRAADMSDSDDIITRQRKKKRTQNLSNRTRPQRCLTDRQKYWIRRSRLLAVSRRRSQLLQMRTKMQSESGMSIFDVQLLFNKAEHHIKAASTKVQKLHAKLSAKAQDCLQYIPTDRHAAEADIVTAFEGLRIHTSATEPYFWEHSSKLLSTTTPIPVDHTGQAHVYNVVSSGQSTHTGSKSDCKKSWYWECNTGVCSISNGQIKGTVDLLNTIANTQPANTIDFYINIDRCKYETRSDRRGHSVHCTAKSGCNSLLRPARALSCHFPNLRSMIRRIYDLRRLSLCVRAVNHEMASGDYSRLQAAIELLDQTVQQICVSGTTENTGDDDEDPQRQSVSEDAILEQYGKSLHEVAESRDTYNIQSCDVCEQLRKDLRTLKSCEKLKGFESEKMHDIIELLYQNKTQHEDIDEFLESMIICSYCVDKLRSNKVINRSVFNRLTVIPTPDCIRNLNLFERTLIKFCMTCVTIVRLGQVTNKVRPHSELTAALKGRIAYLPVNVQANAKFLPENLLNVDSLVLLVGGQPTQKHKIWTSVVDLCKVHEALNWLRQHNQLYKDVPAYTVEDLDRIIKDRVNTTETNNSTEQDNILLKKLDDASKSYLYENFTIQPLNSSIPADVVIDYQLNKVSGQSMDIFDTDLDVKAFPELFPTGEYGIKDTMREMKIATSDFIRSRLLNKDPKFRLNINYLFHCFQVQEVSNMCHSIGHMLRSVSGNNMSAKAFHERLERKDGEINNNMFSLMANMRGSKEYFAKLGMDVKWMMKTLGPPTLFVTCSTAEWLSDSFINYLRNINSSVPGIDSMTPAELCAMDPVNVSIHFHKKWDATFNKLIRSKNQPVFGQVQDYVYRIEYQARGAPHVHAILWIKDAPILGQNTASEVQEYIKSIITCAKPDKNSSPTLHSLVSRFQTHKCNKYCLKTYKRANRFFKKCRFGFPRPVKGNISLNDVIDCLAINRRKQPRKRLYHLQRTKEETHINDYNAALLLANQANVDVQYIGHLGSRLPYYITDYMTKNEKSEQDTMWKDIFTSTKSLGSNAMSYILQSVKSRQVGANEAADRLLGHKLYSKSRQLRFADLQKPDKAKRVLKAAEEIGRLLKSNPESPDIFQTHWVLDVYPDRPEELESSSLHEIISWYEKEKDMPGSSKPLQLKHLPYYLRRRKTTPYIVTHQTINPHQSDENKEIYYYYLLKLFKPWRNEQHLQIPGLNFYETYIFESDHLPDMVKYHQQNMELSQQDEGMEKAIKDRAQQLSKIVTEQDQEDDEHGALAGCMTDHVQNAMEDLITAHSLAARNKERTNLEEQYALLNTDQKRIVDKVVTAVCQETEPIRLIVSGQGGTGKSRVITIIEQLVSRHFKCNSLSVVVAAPTGLAAFNIGGTTIHRLLCLPVEHGKPADYTRLSQDQLKIIRATLKDLHLLIIDEVSMVSSLTLLFIHMRLTEIMCNNDYFGGLSVVFFADLLQLPPVKGNQPFVPVTFLEAKQRVGSIASLDLWKIFSYDELTINMRQSGDRQYADLLSDLRTGKITDTAHSLLSQRLIVHDRRATVSEVCELYIKLVESNDNPLILLPRTALCDEVNAAMLQRIGNDIHRLTAIDTLDTIVNKKLLSKVQKAYEKTEEDTTRTAGLEKIVCLCVGARVMLKRNKDVDAGLVNGSVGTVAGFDTTTSSTGTKIHSVIVQFKNIDSLVTIHRESCSFEVLKNIFYTRKQFPLMLAFAITIHKSQGLSLQSVIVDAGAGTFGCGMVYVALSRVTSLNGLHLIDLDRKKIQCDQKAIQEYNRLRQLYTPHLSIIPQEKITQEPRQTSKPEGTKKRKRSSTDNNYQVTQKRQATINKQSTTGQSTSISVDVTVSHSEQCNIYDHCQTASIGTDLQLDICERLNLRFKPENKRQCVHDKTPTAYSLQQEIQRKTGRLANVHIYNITGDGNCLFRALSLAVTRSQDQHVLLRSYIVNHMLHDSNRNSMEQLFLQKKGQNSHFLNYLINMEKPGVWGTDQEITSAASLLQCSIICYSKYSSDNQFCLQHFPPHFATSQACNSSCNHPTIYLLNSSGNHYETATVMLTTSEM